MADQRPVLDQVNIVARDMDAAVAFYRRLGIDIPDRDPKWDPHHRSANTAGGTDLDIDSVEFARRWDKGWRAGHEGAGCVIGFRLLSREEVDRVYADLTGAGYTGQEEPYDAPWGSRYAVVEDPDGNAIGLMSPRDGAMRRDDEPPS